MRNASLLASMASSLLMSSIFLMAVVMLAVSIVSLGVLDAFLATYLSILGMVSLEIVRYWQLFALLLGAQTIISFLVIHLKSARLAVRFLAPHMTLIALVFYTLSGVVYFLAPQAVFVMLGLFIAGLVLFIPQIALLIAMDDPLPSAEAQFYELCWLQYKLLPHTLTLVSVGLAFGFALYLLG